MSEIRELTEKIKQFRDERERFIEYTVPGSPETGPLLPVLWLKLWQG